MDLLAEFGDQALPFYWAGFVMVGDGSGSIPISRNGVQAKHLHTMISEYPPTKKSFTSE
jgi:hypothetical protein